MGKLKLKSGNKAGKSGLYRQIYDFLKYKSLLFSSGPSSQFEIGIPTTNSRPDYNYDYYYNCFAVEVIRSPRTPNAEVDPFPKSAETIAERL